jgi:MFS family permease
MKYHTLNATQIFFIGYILFEIPSNILIRKIGPATWLSCIAFAWGALSIGIGFIKSWEALAIMRAFLGVLEAVRLAFTLLVMLY